jgi:LysM repeat protein
MRNNTFLISLLFLSISSLYATENSGSTMSKQEYISKWRNTAVEQMIQYNIPASITLAQAILESGSGNSDLARNGNNHFGIKCHDWTGKKMYKDDDTKNECFRVYQNAEESYVDHSLFLAKKQRYAKLFTYEVTDYKSWAQGLREAGYATNPKYPDLLINLIESMKLDEFDKLGNTNLHSTEGLTRNQSSQSDVDDPNEFKTKSNSKSKNRFNQKKSKIKNLKTSKRRLRKLEKEKKDAKDTEDSNASVLESKSSHFVYDHTNKVKYVVVKKGDTFYQIAEEFQLTIKQIHKYNDFDPQKDVLVPGDIVHIQPKRSHSKDASKKYSTEKSIYEISQEEGMKLKSVMNKNQVSEKSIFQKGEKVILR